MEEKTHLIQQLDEARQKMWAEIADIDTQMEIYPGWTIKEVLAHIAGWDDAASSSLRAHAGGEEPAALAVRGIDFYNAQSVETRQALSYDHTIEEWKLAREQFKAAINEMPPDKLGEPLVFPWGCVSEIVHSLS